MRALRELHEPMFRQYSAHPFSDQLARISDILDKRSGILDDVLNDIAFGKDPRVARGMSAETALRAALLRQTQDLTYEELAFQLCDSQAARAFARLADGEAYSASALQANIKAIGTATWQRLQFETVSYASESKFERGRTVRMDATVVKTNIAYPIDSQMLVDALRVVSRNVFWLKEQGVRLTMPFSHKAGRKLMLQILNSSGAEERRAAYQPLIVGSGDVWRWMDCVMEQIAQLPEYLSGRDRRLKELRHVKVHLEPILAQTIVRVVEYLSCLR